MGIKNTLFNLDYAILPGETRMETLETKGIALAGFSDRIGLSLPNLKEILRGEAVLSSAIAQRLESLLGIPASFRNNLETDYQDTRKCLIRKNHG